MRVAADGSGFDPLHTSTVAEAAVRIDRFIYRSYDYGGIALDASLRDHRLIGRLTGESEALKFGLDIEGLLTQTQQAVTVRGTVDTCNLYRMNLSPEKTAISVALDLAASVRFARNAQGRSDRRPNRAVGQMARKPYPQNVGFGGNSCRKGSGGGAVGRFPARFRSSGSGRFAGGAGGACGCVDFRSSFGWGVSIWSWSHGNCRRSG